MVPGDGERDDDDVSEAEDGPLEDEDESLVDAREDEAEESPGETVAVCVISVRSAARIFTCDDRMGISLKS